MPYYSESQLVTRMRRWLKIEKPLALPMGGWEVWSQQLKQSRPVAFWLTETLPDALESFRDLILGPLDQARIYARNRWISRTHVLKTGLKPGGWYEFDERLLHGAFTELVDFVEIEKAHIHLFCHSEERKKQPWWRRWRWFRWSEWRDAELGVKHLTWETTLTYDQDWVGPNSDLLGQPTDQARVAAECLRLYRWWLARPQRPDPCEESGWLSVHDELESAGLSASSLLSSVSDPVLEQKLQESLLRFSEIEQRYHDEDDQALISLIKIRRSLWT